jgi:hypothetical protein
LTSPACGRAPDRYSQKQEHANTARAGKDKVVNHHYGVPFRVLNKVSTLGRSNKKAEQNVSNFKDGNQPQAEVQTDGGRTSLDRPERP